MPLAKKVRLEIVEHASRWTSNILVEVLANHGDAGPLDAETLWVHQQCEQAPFRSDLCRVPFSLMPSIGELIRRYVAEAAQQAEKAGGETCD